MPYVYNRKKFFNIEKYAKVLCKRLEARIRVLETWRHSL